MLLPGRTWTTASAAAKVHWARRKCWPHSISSTRSGRFGVRVYDFLQNKVPGADARDQGYWREVGTIDSYFEAHMDLCAVHPVFSFYNNRWPILTHVPAEPP